MERLLTANMNTAWRVLLPPTTRDQVVQNMSDILLRHMRPQGEARIAELLKVAWLVEEQIYQSATDQRDYLRKISLKMLSLAKRAQAASVTDTPIEELLGNLTLGPGTEMLMHNPGGMPAGQNRERQQLFDRAFQNSVIANDMRSSAVDVRVFQMPEADRQALSRIGPHP